MQVGFPCACIGISTADHWSEKYLKRLLGKIKMDIEGALKTLDELQERKFGWQRIN